MKLCMYRFYYLGIVSTIWERKPLGLCSHPQVLKGKKRGSTVPKEKAHTTLANYLPLSLSVLQQDDQMWSGTRLEYGLTDPHIYLCLGSHVPQGKLAPPLPTIPPTI